LEYGDNKQMTINYLGTSDDPRPNLELELPEVTTTYERISCEYPDRRARYCLPTYDGGKDADKPVAVWQWEPEGHASGQYGSADHGLTPVAPAPAAELERLSREITAALDRRHADPGAYPECAEYFASCRRFSAILQQIENRFAAVLAGAAQNGYFIQDLAEQMTQQEFARRLQELAERVRKDQAAKPQRKSSTKSTKKGKK
jgi:hypothetical protein